MVSNQRPIFSLRRDGLFRLDHTWRYCFPWHPELFVQLPAGMRTNFASIPSLARAVISPIDPDIVEGAAVHDWLVGEFCHRQCHSPRICRLTPDGPVVENDNVTWAQAARILRKIMASEGAPIWKRWAVYLAVRAHGITRTLRGQ